jgi:hypothetical protein
MDMSRYAKADFIKPEDLAAGPLTKTITDIEEGKYGKPVATFEDGSKFSFNATNVTTLIKAFGPSDDEWIGQRIELYAGTICYNGSDNAAVLVRALTSAPEAVQAVKAQRPVRDDDMSDEVPF